MSNLIQKGEYNMSNQDKMLDKGIKIDVSKSTPVATVELFGHVILVEGYALTQVLPVAMP